MAISHTGYPLSRPVDCATSTATARPMRSYSEHRSADTLQAATDVYQYAWKTQAGWAGSCRALVIKLVDGTEHKVFFRF